MSTKVIGITGGIGSGKSAVLDYIEENFNARILKTDEIAHDVMEPGERCYEALKRIFPDEVFPDNAPIDRELMAKAMFSDESLRQKLNAIVHPAVGEYLKEETLKERAQNKFDYVIIESALYTGGEFALLCDAVWNIHASVSVRTERLKRTRGYSDEKIRDILKSQEKNDVLRLTLPVQIDNDGDFEATKTQIKNALGGIVL